MRRTSKVGDAERHHNQQWVTCYWRTCLPVTAATIKHEPTGLSTPQVIIGVLHRCNLPREQPSVECNHPRCREQGSRGGEPGSGAGEGSKKSFRRVPNGHKSDLARLWNGSKTVQMLAPTGFASTSLSPSRGAPCLLAHQFQAEGNVIELVSSRGATKAPVPFQLVVSFWCDFGGHWGRRYNHARIDQPSPLARVWSVCLNAS